MKENIFSVIEKAKVNKGLLSDNQLAAALAMTGGQFNNCKHGRQPFTDAQLRELAKLAGVSYGRLSAMQNEARAKNEVERKAWGKLLEAGLASLAALSVTLSLLTFSSESHAIKIQVGPEGSKTSLSASLFKLLKRLTSRILATIKTMSLGRCNTAMQE